MCEKCSYKEVFLIKGFLIERFFLYIYIYIYIYILIPWPRYIIRYTCFYSLILYIYCFISFRLLNITSNKLYPLSSIYTTDNNCVTDNRYDLHNQYEKMLSVIKSRSGTLKKFNKQLKTLMCPVAQIPEYVSRGHRL